MMLSQQDTGVKPPDGSLAGKNGKQRSGLGLGATNLSGSSVAATEQQAQRCPRCDSLNTKFCYYNNYSLSQPRHFCKNCRRYWTKGGALRNVPVGGGCRKNKRIKQRDPSCLAAFGEVDTPGPPSMLASISGCGIPGFGASTSSLIQSLAHEGQRQLALSRLAGMHALDKRFMTDNGASSTQDLFTLAAAGSASIPGPPLSPFDPSAFTGLSNYSKPDSQPLLFHHQTSTDLSVFFDPMSVTSPILTPQLDHLAVAPIAPPSHDDSENGINNGLAVMNSQLSLMHQGVHVNGITDNQQDEIHMREFQRQQAGQTSAIGDDFTDGNVDMNFAKSKGRSPLSSWSDWPPLGGRTTSAPQAMATSSTQTPYSLPLQVSESSLWNVSWPEMHAALAGSTAAARATLH